MDKSVIRFGAFALAFAVSPAVALAEPITLKLSFFTSDRTVAYAAAIKPFVDAVNKDGEGVVKIEVYPSGTLGKVQRELPQLVLSGGADIAFIIPGQNPERCTDSGVIELPGLFKGAVAQLFDVRNEVRDRAALAAARTVS